MPLLAPLVPAWMQDAVLDGTTVDAHLHGLGQLADLVEGPGIITLDARYLRLAPATLEALASVGGTLEGPEGIIAVCRSDDTVSLERAGATIPLRGEQAVPITDLWELSLLGPERVRRRIEAHARAGVRFIDPGRVWLGAEVILEPGVIVWPDVVLRGQTRVSSGAVILERVSLTDCTVDVGVRVQPGTVGEGAQIGSGSTIGPMAHLRPGTVLEGNNRVGNFVETKKTHLALGAKASHLSYLGDTMVGAAANVGAGTITCNYDGWGKHPTVIGAGAFIGSNASLVAPVTIGQGAIVGAGSVVTRDVPTDSLSVERSPQRILEGRAPTIHQRNRRRAEEG